jgi:hypothetical protein
MKKYVESAEEKNNFHIIYNKHNQKKAKEAEQAMMIQ